MQQRLYLGQVSSKDSHAGYLLNRGNLQSTNECFLAPGAKAVSYKRISNAVPPSQVGRPTNFFSLRGQLASEE